MWLVLVLPVFVGTIIWVGADASRRDWKKSDNTITRSATGWVVRCLFLWIVFLPLYLRMRSSAPLRATVVGPLPEVPPQRPDLSAVNPPRLKTRRGRTSERA